LVKTFPRKRDANNNTVKWKRGSFLCSPCRGVKKKTFGAIECKKQTEVTQNHENEYVRGIGQGEARHRKYKRLKLGGGQAYDRSSD
jgi:hypothetical protein